MANTRTVEILTAAEAVTACGCDSCESDDLSFEYLSRVFVPYTNAIANVDLGAYSLTGNIIATSFQFTQDTPVAIGEMLISVDTAGTLGWGYPTAYSTYNLYLLQEDPPTNFVMTSALDGAGVLTGKYFYAVTFVTSLGESNPGYSSEAVGNVGITTSSNQVKLSNIPTGSSKVIARKIYRTHANAEQYKLYYLATISDNTTTEYIDNNADGTLGDLITCRNTTGGNIFVNSVLNYEATKNVILIGEGAGGDTPGFGIIAIGNDAGHNITTAHDSIFIGVMAGYSGTDSAGNIAIGDASLYYNVTGHRNVCIGINAGLSVLGSHNTHIGEFSGLSATGSGCTSLGAGSNYSTGTDNRLSITVGTASSPYELIWGDPTQVVSNYDTKVKDGYDLYSQTLYGHDYLTLLRTADRTDYLTFSDLPGSLFLNAGLIVADSTEYEAPSVDPFHSTNTKSVGLFFYYGKNDPASLNTSTEENSSINIRAYSQNVWASHTELVHGHPVTTWYNGLRKKSTSKVSTHRPATLNQSDIELYSFMDSINDNFVDQITYPTISTREASMGVVCNHIPTGEASSYETSRIVKTKVNSDAPNLDGIYIDTKVEGTVSTFNDNYVLGPIIHTRFLYDTTGIIEIYEGDNADSDITAYIERDYYLYANSYTGFVGWYMDASTSLNNYFELDNVPFNMYIDNGDMNAIYVEYGNAMVSGVNVLEIVSPVKIELAINDNFELDVKNNYIKNVADPVDDADAANKHYVDISAKGLNLKPSVRVATTTALISTYTATPTTLTANANGPFPSIDGITLLVGDTLLVKDESHLLSANNGIYILTQSGGLLAPWILTRTPEADTWDELVSALILVEEGATNADTGWITTIDSGGTLGTTNIGIIQFSGIGTIVNEGFGIEVLDTATSITDNRLRSFIGSGGTIVQQNPLNSFEIEVSSIGVSSWVIGTGTGPINLAVNTGYVLQGTGGGIVSLTLPNSTIIGDIIEIVSDSTTDLFQISQTVTQQIRLGNVETTLSTGSITSSQPGDRLKLLAVDTSGSRWIVIDSIGSFTIS